ncbi:MAG: hypothetical protein IJ409_02350 [Lachnospiraceae bacterium]|nr:hypothetical protein [Lachnospiraceae bacterium]
MNSMKELETYWLEKERRKQLAQILEELEQLEKKKKYQISDWEGIFSYKESVWVFRQREVYEKWERLLRQKTIDRPTYDFLLEKLEAIYAEDTLENNRQQIGVLPEKDMIAFRLKAAYEKPRRTFELSDSVLDFLKRFLKPAIPALVGAIWVGAIEYENQKEQEQRAKYESIAIETWEESMDNFVEESMAVNISLMEGISLRNLFTEIEQENIVFKEIVDEELISEVIGEEVTATETIAFEIKEKKEYTTYSVYMNVNELGIKESSRVYFFDGTVCEQISVFQGQAVATEGMCLYDLKDYWVLMADFPLVSEEKSGIVVIVK